MNEVLSHVHGLQMHSEKQQQLSHEGGKHTAKDDWARGVFPQYAREGTLVSYTWRFVERLLHMGSKVLVKTAVCLCWGA
jgi:hypothetical protein